MKKTRIMIIEDDQAIADSLKMHLEYLYCDVISVSGSVKNALEELGRISPDIIMMDIELDTGITASVDSIETGSFTRCSQCRVLYYNSDVEEIELNDESTEMVSENETTGYSDIREEWRNIARKKVTRQIPVISIAGRDNEGTISQAKLDFLFCYVLIPVSTKDLKVTLDLAIHTAQIHARRMSDRDELKRSDERYKALVDNMASGVAIYEVVGDGEDFIYLDFNKAAEKIENQSREELIGRSVFEVRPGVRESGLTDLLRKVWETGEPEHHPLTLYEDSRLKKYYETYVYKLSTGEIVSLFNDETMKKNSEDEMKKLAAQLQHSQKMEAIGTMAGGIAHDFNNILFPILGFTELLIQESQDGSQEKEYLSQILKAAGRAKDLVKQILTFSRQQNHEMVPLQIQPIAKEIIKLSRAMLPSTIKIESFISPGCGMVMADPTQIHQVMMNLIANSFHAMESSGGRLVIRISPVNSESDYIPAVLPAGRYTCLEVSDNGEGMDANTLDRIFEPYFTTKEKDKGTGLGLAVVHGIVKACQGEIEVTSEPGKGSAFRIFLPEINKAPGRGGESSGNEILAGNESVMVVDDEPVITKILGAILERAGYRVTTECDPIEAINRFSKSPDKFDLVLTDLTMPELTGDILCSRIKSIRPEIPVILLTGFSDKAATLVNEKAHIDRVLKKPVISQDLLKSVREILDSKP